MIEGRPRESLVQYENPIEVSQHFLIEILNILFTYRFPVDTIWIHSRRVSVSIQ